MTPRSRNAGRKQSCAGAPDSTVRGTAPMELAISTQRPLRESVRRRGLARRAPGLIIELFKCFFPLFFAGVSLGLFSLKLPEQFLRIGTS